MKQMNLFEMTEMKNLVGELNEASKAYYSTDKELMDNVEYDKKYDALKQMEESTGIILEDSPTQRVGYEVVSELKKVRHEYPALSLDKTKDREALRKWLNGKEGVISDKLDGLTAVATYDGKLVQLVTRGNGEIGEDVTHNAPYIKGLPTSVPYDGKFVVRGEVVITYDDFEEINKTEVEPYKNPRNLASGSLRCLDSEKASKRKMQFIAFNLVVGPEVVKTVSTSYALLSSYDFQVVDHTVVTEDTILDEIAKRESLVATKAVPADGLVLTYNDIAYGKSLGSTGKFPRHSMAFKWADETADTTLKRIMWSASRTGLLNPVAIFDTVELEGTSVSKATLHNLSYIKRLDLRVGSNIKVAKMNMIIPAVVENDSTYDTSYELADYNVPTVCPVCEGKVEIEINNDTETVRCINSSCPAKQLGKFVHFVERDCMNIDGFAESTITMLINNGYLKKYADFYHLDEHKEIANLEGYGKKSYEKMLAAVEASRKCDFISFIHAMGIENVGKGQAKLLKKHLESIYGQYQNEPYNLVDFLSALVKDNYDFTVIEGFGEVIASSLTTWVRNYLVDPYILHLDESLPNWEVINLLKELTFVDVKPVAKESNSNIEGKIFVITGSLNTYNNRNELISVIEQNGGKVSGSVSSKTNYLINNDTESATGKNKKAKELGIPVISEQDFNAML